MGWGQKIAGNAGGPILKWTTTGQEVDGVLVAIRTTPARGQYKEGQLADLRKADGTMVTVGVKTVLQRQLAEIKVGTRVLIKYLGKERGTSGVEYHNFETTPWIEDGQTQEQVTQKAPQQQQQAAPPQAGASDGGKPTFESLKAKLIEAKGAAAGNAIADAIASMEGDPAERMLKTLIAQGVKF
jgi:hypothetical protein